MSHSLIVLLVWVVICYPIWSPRCRRIRAAKGSTGVRVSRNNPRPKTGPAYEQDYPWPECFDDMEDW